MHMVWWVWCGSQVSRTEISAICKPRPLRTILKRFCISSTSHVISPKSEISALAACPPPEVPDFLSTKHMVVGESEANSSWASWLLGFSQSAWVPPVARNGEHRPHPNPLNHNLHFNKIPGWVLCTSQFGKHQVIGPRFLFLLHPALHAKPFFAPLTRSGGLDAETEVARTAQIQSAEVEGPVH